MEWISVILKIVQAADTIKDLYEYLDKKLAKYGGLAGFAEQYGISVEDILDCARDILDLDSDDSDSEESDEDEEDSDSEESDETATVMCPHCHQFVIAYRGNDIYPCPYCKKDIDVGVFDGAFSPQDDNDSSGWAVAEWLVKSFDLPSDSEEIRSLLEDSHKEGEVANPDVFLDAMQNLGLKPWVPIDADDKETIFDDDNDFVNDVFSEGGQIAVCFQFADKRLGCHWVGLELHKGEIRVMDPIQAQGYMPIEDWRAGIDVGQIAAVYGFTV